MAGGHEQSGMGGHEYSCVGLGRAKYLRGQPVRSDDEPIVGLSIGELRGLMRQAVAEAMGMKGGPVLLDRAELAERLGCSTAHIDHLRKRGLPTMLVGNAVRFEMERVLDWLREGEAPPAA